MKLKRINQILKSDLFFENLVDKSLGNAKLKLSYSERQRVARGMTKGKKSHEKVCTDDFLTGLPELMRPEFAATVLGVSPKTIYDWHYRSTKRKVPVGLFVKLNRSLLIRTSVLKEWIASQNPSLRSGRE